MSKAQAKARNGVKAKKAPVKRRRRKTDLVRVPRGKIGFPQGMRTTLRMTHTEVFEPSGSTASVLPIQANGMFQPISGNGKQPRGFAQFMGIYANYTVVATKCHARYMFEGYTGPSASTSGTDQMLQTVIIPSDQTDAVGCLPMAVGIRKGTSIVSSVDAEDLIERERTKCVFITPQEGARTLTQSAGVGEFYKNYTTVSSEGYTGTYQANPTVPVYMEVWCAKPSNIADSNPKVVAFIELEFDVIFTNPQALVQGSSSGA